MTSNELSALILITFILFKGAIWLESLLIEAHEIRPIAPYHIPCKRGTHDFRACKRLALTTETPG